MHRYIAPELDIIKFNTHDVICASDIVSHDAERDNAYVPASSLFGGGGDYFLDWVFKAAVLVNKFQFIKASFVSTNEAFLLVPWQNTVHMGRLAWKCLSRSE